MEKKYVDIRDRRKIPWKKLISIFCGLVVAVAMGLMIFHFQWFTMTQGALMFLVLGISFGLSILFHELGHFVTGLLSGYELLSFRLGPLALIHAYEAEEEPEENPEETPEPEESVQGKTTEKEKTAKKPSENPEKTPEKVAMKTTPKSVVKEEEAPQEQGKEPQVQGEESLEETDLEDDLDDEEEEKPEEVAVPDREKYLTFHKANCATGFGACLMMPKEADYHDVDYELYLRGGALGNLVSIPVSALFLIFFLQYWYVILAFSLVALGFALCSLIPFRFDGKPNDGYIKMLCDESWENTAAYVNRLKMLGASARGISIGDMPETWFFGKFDLSQRMCANPLEVAIWQATADRFLIHGELFQAKIIFEAIGNQPALMPLTQQQGLYRCLFAMLLEGRVEETRIYPIPKFMRRAMKKLGKRFLLFPRYSYGYAMLVSESGKKMKESMARFEKIAAVSLLEGEIEDERILLDRLKDVIVLR